MPRKRKVVDFPLHDFKKIAIIRRDGFGDLLCAYPTILYLKEKAPSAEMMLFVDARNSPLLSYLPPVDHLVILPNRGNKYFHLLKAAMRYRWRKFDLAISSKTSPMKLMNLFLFALGAKRRVAYCDENWHSRLVNFSIPFNPRVSDKQHQAVKTLQMIAPHLSTIPFRFLPKITIPKKIAALYARQTPHDKITLLLSASTTNPLSRLHPIKYANIVNKLSQHLPLHVVIIAEKKDEKRAQMIQHHLNLSCGLYFPRNFDEFMVFLEKSDLLFVGDGGVAHLGAALGKPAVVLFGSVSPAQWAPLGERIATLYHPSHVDAIKEETILVTLYKLSHDTRRNPASRYRIDTSESLSTTSSFF